MQDNTQAFDASSASGVDRRTFWLGVSAVIFAVLIAAHASRPDLVMPVATAGETVDGRDYSVVTSAQPDGNEAIYVLDKRTGLLAFIQWDSTAGRPEVIDIKPVQGAFGG